jgi:hypothetical protein
MARLMLYWRIRGRAGGEEDYCQQPGEQPDCWQRCWPVSSARGSSWVCDASLPAGSLLDDPQQHLSFVLWGVR